MLKSVVSELVVFVRYWEGNVTFYMGESPYSPGENGLPGTTTRPGDSLTRTFICSETQEREVRSTGNFWDFMFDSNVLLSLSLTELVRFC